MIERVTAARVESHVSACVHRGTPGGTPGIAFSQSETARGEPRQYYVLCQHSSRRTDGRRIPIGYKFCECAQPDGRDCPSQRTADARAEWVKSARQKYLLPAER